MVSQNRARRMFWAGIFLAGLASVLPLSAQTTGATFGEVVRLGGTPSDVVLDEGRMRLYAMNQNANRVDVYDYASKQLLQPIPVGNRPLAGAISPDGQFLYVTNSLSATLSVIDLSNNLPFATVPLPARPEGVAVGYDGRVVISTLGTGVNNLANTLLIYDRLQSSSQVTPVPFPPPPPTPAGLPALFARPTTQFNGKLIATPDRQFIVGVSVINNNTQTITYLYEVASGTILLSRTVTGQSTVLSMSPDGARFMAGFTLYNTQTLAVMAQQTTSNAPFPMPASFNTAQNNGGSAFSPDGTVLYSAFNVAPNTLPVSRPSSSILLISDPRNLGIKMGIRMPESIIDRIIITSNGEQAWGLSESGLLYLPLGQLYDYPILQPDTTQVFLAQDDCNKGVAKASLKINNLGKGKLTFSVPNTGAAVIAQATSGLAPSSVVFTMDAGRTGVVRQAGTNLSTGTATMTGFPINVDLASADAINIPNRILVYMNYRQSDMRGVIAPIPKNTDNALGLLDLQLDEARGKLYLANAGFNRIEVFDTKKQRLLEPMETCQLPRQMALSTDGTYMYVACQGSEGLGIMDLDLGRMVGEVNFPPIPRAGNAAVITPRTLAMGIIGLQFVMSNGTIWKVVGNDALPRTPDPLTTTTTGAAETIPAPQQMIASPDGTQILLLGATGKAHLFDAIADTFSASRQLFTNPIVSYYGPLAIAPDGGFMLANGLILNNSLTVIGGAERPGTVQTGPPTAPGQPPTTTIVSAGQRNIAALAAVNKDVFIRMTTPVRQAINSVTRDDVRATLELVDVRSGGESLLAVMPENPVSTLFGNGPSRISPRLMVVDSKGENAYAISLSGLSVVPLKQATSLTRPTIPQGSRGIVNANDGSQSLKPGSFVAISGQNLGLASTADQIPLPTVLGGTCVTFNDIALPLISVSPSQITAQLPDTLMPGLKVVNVRSLSMAQSSDPIVINVLKP